MNLRVEFGAFSFFFANSHQVNSALNSTTNYIEFSKK